MKSRHRRVSLTLMFSERPLTDRGLASEKCAKNFTIFGFSSAARDRRVAQEQAELADDAVSERRNIAMAQTERAPPKRTAMAQTERASPKRYLRDTT